MSDPFKLFISSSAKTKRDIQKEIQRVIRAKIENIVEDAIRNAIDEGEKIPPRSNINYSAPQNSSPTLSADELAYAPETPDTQAPIVDKIREMRKLGQTFYHGYMLRQCAEISIVKQGEFMVDVTDDFPRTVYCGTERPIYGALSLEQLRTYFTWRTDVRRGVYNKTDKAYIILYCYELMNKIGVLSSQDAFNRLIELWDKCRGACSYLDTIMPYWLKDFYAFNNIEGEFSEYEIAFPLAPQNCDTDIDALASKDYRGKLDYLMQHSSYNLSGSIFFSEETQPLLDGASEAVLKALDEYFTQRGISMFELICGKMRKDHTWEPFVAAFVDRDRMDGFHACTINARQRYTIKRGAPCFERFEPSIYRGLIGYTLKSIESVLRKRTGFRYGISPNLSIVLDEFTNRDKLYAAASEPEFAQLITDTVNAWCDKNRIFPPKKEKKSKKNSSIDDIPLPPEYGTAAPVKVELTAEALSQIRAEAEETARKLVIEEYDNSLPAEQIEEITSRIIDEVFDQQAEQACFEVRSQYDFSTLPEEWRTLAEALDAQALELLKAVANGTATEYCREHGTLPQAAFEQLNSAAQEHIGDSIIENGKLIPDYAEDITAILALMK